MSAVISVENLWKEYRLGVLGYGSLQKDVQSWWARLCGKEDPNLPVGHPGLHGNGCADRIWALRDISLEVKDGEALGIIGRNGSGKSTLLKTISRVTAPTKGSVKIKGRVASLLEVGTGFHPELTGRENVFLNGAILGMTVREIKKKFDEIVDFSGVEKFIDTPVKRYSSGMYVRLAFAVAAHLDSEILMLDEVLAVGDAAFQFKCLGKMDQVANQGRTVLFVSHGMGAVREFCRRAVLLQEGRIADYGPADEVVDRYTDQVYEDMVGDREDARPHTVNLPDDGAGAMAISQILLSNKEGEPTNVFDLNDEIHIGMDYVVRESLAQSMIILTVSRGGLYILSTHDTDLNPDLLILRKKGEYTATVRLPGRLLTPGTYALTATVAAGAMGELFHRAYRFVVSFTITNESENDLFKNYSPARGTFMFTEWKWQTLRREAPAPTSLSPRA